MGAPQIVAGSTIVQDASATTSRDINVPTHSGNDTIYIVTAGSQNSTTPPTVTISGFTAIIGPVGTTSHNVFVFKKLATSSEGSTYTIASNNQLITAIAFAVHSGGDINVTNTENSGGPTSQITLNSITTTVNETLKIAVIGIDDSPGVTSVETLSTHSVINEALGTGKPGLSLQYKELPTATTDSSQTAVSNAGDNWYSIAFAIENQKEVNVSQFGNYLEINEQLVTEEADVTQVANYLELNETITPFENISITQTGDYIEIDGTIIPFEVLSVSQLANYVEINQPIVETLAVNVSQFANYVELNETITTFEALYISQLATYLELNETIAALEEVNVTQVGQYLEVEQLAGVFKYRVKSFNVNGESAYTNEVQVVLN